MYFKLLPENIKAAIQKLTVDEVFQERFGTDKRLDEIDDMKENKAEEYKALLSVYGKKLIIDNHIIPNLTPAMWSFLWATGSPFVSSHREPTENDVDYFMYILYNGITSENAATVFTESLNFCEEKLNMKYSEALLIIINVIKYAFRPLKLFPATGGGYGKLSFDADWLTSLVARVHNVTGYTPDYIINELPITACCYYFAQYARIQGVENIHKRTDEEILILQNERVSELICERLIELEVFPPEEFSKWKRVMLTKP